MSFVQIDTGASVTATVEIDTGDVRLSCLVAGEGPVVLALHGFPDNRDTFRPLLPALVAAGYTVVIPALRGYAPSGIAKSGRHDALAAGADAVFLADHFAPGKPVRLIGHDWGALAAFAATSMAPERFSHLATLAVPHPVALLRRVSLNQLRKSWYMGLFQLPGVAEARLVADDFSLIDRLWRDWSPGYQATADEMRAVKDGIRDRVGPVLAYYRALLSPVALIRGRTLFAKTRVPSIHLHGEDDGCIGIETAEGAERFYEKSYSLHRVAGAGHFLTREKPAAITEVLIKFLRAETLRADRKSALAP